MTRPPTALSAARVIVGVAVVAILLYAFGLQSAQNGTSLIDYFGFFTNLTSLLTALVLIGAGLLSLRGRDAPLALTVARGVTTSCMIVVAVIYNVLVPGTGAAPPWVSVTLHIALPALVLVDWIAVRDHSGLRWSHFGWLLPYPLIWLGVTLVRGATDGWVPYGFLLPERGWQSILLTSLGLLAALAMAGAIVWATRGSHRTRHTATAG